MGINWNVDNKLGSDCSGLDGESNRVLILENTQLTFQDEFLVYASGLELTILEEYIVEHKASNTEITFLNPLWNDMTVIVRYSQGVKNLYDNITENKLGSDCSGLDGESNRVLILENTQLTVQQGMVVFASGLSLAEGIEYTAVHNLTNSEITFLNPLWNDMEIEVIYLVDTGFLVFSEVISLEDFLIKESIRILLEEVGLADGILFNYIKLLTENLNLLDTKTKLLLREYLETLNLESTCIKKYIKNLTSILTLSEEIINSINKSLEDSLTFEDIYSRIWQVTQNYSETAFLNDLVNKEISLSDFTETINLSTSFARGKAFSETINLSEWILGGILKKRLLQLREVKPIILNVRSVLSRI